MSIIVLLPSNTINDNNASDLSYNSNVVDLSFLTNYTINFKYVTLTNYTEIINSIDKDTYSY